MELFNNKTIRLYKDGDEYILSHAMYLDTITLTDTCFDQVNKHIFNTGVKSKYDKTSSIVLDEYNTIVYPSGGVYRLNGKPRALEKKGNRYYVRLPKRTHGLLLGARTRKSVAKLVAETFIPNIFNFRYVGFKDGNSQNLHYSNLEWMPYSSNKQRVMIYNKWVKDKMSDAIRGYVKDTGVYVPKDELIEEVRVLTAEKHSDEYWNERHSRINIPNGLHDYISIKVFNNNYKHKYKHN